MISSDWIETANPYPAHCADAFFVGADLQELEVLNVAWRSGGR
jgi:hypothetical protein